MSLYLQIFAWIWAALTSSWGAVIACGTLSDISLKDRWIILAWLYLLTYVSAWASVIVWATQP